MAAERLPQQLAKLQDEAECWTPEDVLRWGIERFGESLAIASSFGAEDVALIDMASRITPGVRVFTLDTDFLFPETYELIDRVEARYGIKIERSRSALTPLEQDQKFGTTLWATNPDQCCDLRKVQPLRSKLSSLVAWVTGVRREQAPTRANTRKLEWDARFGLVKLNPVADWTWNMVWDYIRANGVPYNPLHDRNYPSIGCTHCTRPVLEGEDQRAGRWSGLNKIECGLHLKK
jgi:phosphoadenosine phosphosulfate reductase